MSKNANYRAKRADRPAAVAVANRKAATAAIHRMAQGSSMQHSDQMESGLAEIIDFAEAAGVQVWDHEIDMNRPLVAIVAELGDNATARVMGSQIVKAIDDVLTHKAAIELIEGCSIHL